MTADRDALVAAAEAALHVLETPGDFTAEEYRHVLIDLDRALHPLREVDAGAYEISGEVGDCNGRGVTE